MRFEGSRTHDSEVSVHESNREILKPSWSLGNGTVSQNYLIFVSFTVETNPPRAAPTRHTKYLVVGSPLAQWLIREDFNHWDAGSIPRAASGDLFRLGPTKLSRFTAAIAAVEDWINPRSTPV